MKLLNFTLSRKTILRVSIAMLAVCLLVPISAEAFGWLLRAGAGRAAVTTAARGALATTAARTVGSMSASEMLAARISRATPGARLTPIPQISDAQVAKMYAGENPAQLTLSKRHFVDRLGVPAEKNSVYLGRHNSPEIVGDFYEIAFGSARRGANGTYVTSAGRRWGRHGDSIHPQEGPYVVQMSRHEYRIIEVASKEGTQVALNQLNSMYKNGAFRSGTGGLEQYYSTKAFIYTMDGPFTVVAR